MKICPFSIIIPRYPPLVTALSHRVPSLSMLRLKRSVRPSSQYIVPKIHTLPNEVMGGVLKLTDPEQYDDDHDYDDLSRLRGLARVCQRWLSFVSGTPQLWSRIGANQPIEIVRLFQRKSAAVQLTIFIHRGVSREFINTVSASSSRWRAIQSDTGSIAPMYAAEFLRHSPPAGEDLDMYGDLGTATSNPFAKRSVQLLGTSPFKNITLRCTQVGWDSPRLSRLRSLYPCKL